LSFAEDAIYLGSADWADALCHATTRVGDLYSSLKITLLFALNAVSVTLVCLCHFFLRSTHGLGLMRAGNNDTPAHAQNPESTQGLWSELLQLYGGQKGSFGRLKAIEVGAGQLGILKSGEGLGEGFAMVKVT